MTAAETDITFNQCSLLMLTAQKQRALEHYKQCMEHYIELTCDLHDMALEMYYLYTTTAIYKLVFL